jgi:hypothetical protein
LLDNYTNAATAYDKLAAIGMPGNWPLYYTGGFTIKGQAAYLAIITN